MQLYSILEKILSYDLGCVCVQCLNFPKLQLQNEAMLVKKWPAAFWQKGLLGRCACKLWLLPSFMLGGKFCTLVSKQAAIISLKNVYICIYIILVALFKQFLLTEKGTFGLFSCIWRKMHKMYFSMLTGTEQKPSLTKTVWY